jgi:hypothetical protein
MLSVIVVALLLAPADDVGIITPDQARDHVGQEVVATPLERDVPKL